MMRKALMTLTIAFASLAPTALHANTIFNPVTGFTPATNGTTTSPWSYAHGTPASYTLDTQNGTFGAYGFSYWGQPSGDNLPAIGVNGTPYGTVNVPTSELWMHPGSGAGEDSILVFTVPTTGYYAIDGAFYRRDTSNGSGDGVTVSGFAGASSFSNPLGPALYGYSLPFTTSGYDLYTAGQVFLFSVNKNSDYQFDSTGLNLNITRQDPPAVPEPSSLILLGTGVLSAVGAARRRFIKA